MAQLDRAPKSRQPQPRYLIPDWFDELRANVRSDLAEAEEQATREQSERAIRAKALKDAEQAAARARASGDDAEVHAARTKLHALRRSTRADEIFDRWSKPANEVPELRDLSNALDDWKRWAAGYNLPDKRLAAMLGTLNAAPSPGCAALATPLAPSVTVPTVEPPGVNLGVGL